ncbi:MAG: polysaccharide biosynthesis tyrosine autokinase [Bacteroidaceae bacterium]|nr:polysaccharide biosynthesis tyrosine autokinase [Bacteroidaceae bacterium]
MNKKTDSFLTIADLWHLCVTHWRWFLASVFICLFLAVNYLTSTPFLYSRKAVVMVREESLGNSSTEKNGSEFNDMGFVKQNNNVTNVIRHYKSLDVLMDVAYRLDSTLKGGYLINKATAIQSRLAVENTDSKSTIIDLTYRDRSTGEAERVLNMILQVYDERWIEEKQRSIMNTSQFIDSRLKLLQNDLNIIDDSVAHFKSRYGITNLDRVSDLYLQQQSSSDSEILRLMNQKAMAEYIQSLLNDNSSEQQLLLVNSGLNNSVLDAQISQYNSELMQLQNHLNYTSTQNPLILNQERELENLRSKIRSNLKSHIHTIDIQLQSLTDYNDEATSKVVSNPAQAKLLATIERERTVKESLYVYLLQKKEENEISLTYTSSNIQLIELPHGSGKPTSPKRSQVILAAFFLGFLMPVTVIFLRASFDNSVRDRYDIERSGNIPLLCEIPLAERKSTWRDLQSLLRLKSKQNPIVVAHGKDDVVNEAFRMLRTKLEELCDNNEKNCHAFLITSNQQDAGNSFIAVNLSLTLAIGGKRVLLIDADLRKASTSQCLNAQQKGLSDYLNGQVDAVDPLLLHMKDYPTLDVLPAGTILPNPTELLGSKLFTRLIETARSKYEMIIIDSPVASYIADAEIIKKHVDYSLFIVRAGLYLRRDLDELESSEDDANNRQLVILNGVNVDFQYGGHIPTNKSFLRTIFKS